MPEIFEKLNSFKRTDTVVFYMNAMSKDSPMGKKMTRISTDFRRPYYRWNLTSCKRGRGTIEFRQAPGSECKEDTLTWITFAVSFVTAAVNGAVKLDPKNEPTSLDELKDFVHSGAITAKVTEKNWQLIEKLFKGKKMLPSGSYAHDPMNISEQDLELMTRMMSCM